MSYNNSDDYYDSSASEGEEEFNVSEVATTKEEAVAAVAQRIAEMQRLYRETIALAAEFDVRVNFSLESEHNRGHNRGEHIYWSASSQHC